MMEDEAYIINKFNNKLAKAFVKAGGVPNFNIKEFLGLWEELEAEFGLDEIE